MADSAQERTEQPTAKRLRKAREQGNVPTSQEMISAITLIVLLFITVKMASKVTHWARVEISTAFKLNHSHLAHAQAFTTYISERFISALMIVMPFLATLFASSIIINIVISGKNINTKELFEFKLSNLKLGRGLKNMFSVHSLVRLLINFIKLVFVGSISYFYVKKKIPILATFQWNWDVEILTSIAQLILGVSIRLCIGLFIIGIIDLIYQKWKYTKDLKMTKQEVKDEKRDEDTPPEVRKKVRQKQFEIGMRRMLQDVPKADVVLVNPTHVAVAIQYDSATMEVPVVLAKGGDHVCEKIKEIARAYGVPIIRRPALARNIFSTVELGHPIPETLFLAVAEVLALIYRLKKSRRGVKV